MTTKFPKPQTMKFQLAPCQIPVVNHTTKDARYTGTLFPILSGRCFLLHLLSFSIGPETEIG